MPSRRTTLTYIGLVAALVVVAGCGQQPSSTPPAGQPAAKKQVEQPKTATVINVGLLLPLTGGAASYGENARKAADLALKEFSAAHPDIKVAFKVEDSRGEAAVGTKAVSKLVDLDNVVAVMGCVTSGVTLAVAPVMDEKKVPIISPGASSPNLTGAGEYVFRTWPSDVFEAEGIVRHIVDKGYSKIALLRINNEYGLAMENAVKSSLGGDGKVSIVASETFEQGAREMRAQIQKIKEAAPDAIYFIGFPEAAVVFGKGYGEAGLKMPVMATSAFEDPQVPQNTGGALNGTVYTKPLSKGAGTEAFKAAYKTAYREDPGVVADTAYDATKLILQGIAEAVSKGGQASGTSIHDYLLTVKEYEGASGTLSFDAKGDVVKPIGLFILKDGAYQEVGG